MHIRAYLKPHCGWSRGVRAVLKKYDLPFEDVDIISSQENYAEMVQRSGQPLSPCVEIDGTMLPDISGEEVENYLLSHQLVQANPAPAGVPTNAPCSNEEHAQMQQAQTQAKTIRFF